MVEWVLWRSVVFFLGFLFFWCIQAQVFQIRDNGLRIRIRMASLKALPHVWLQDMWGLCIFAQALHVLHVNQEQEIAALAAPIG